MGDGSNNAIATLHERTCTLGVIIKVQIHAVITGGQRDGLPRATDNTKVII